MSILKDGFYKVTRADNGELHVSCKGANGETVQHSETVKSWDAVSTNVQAAIRAAHGRFGIVVDATLENLGKRKIYYRLGADGGLKVIAVQDDAVQTEMDTIVDAPAAQQQVGAGSNAANTSTQAGQEGGGQ